MSMEFIKNFDWSPKSLLKVALIIIVGSIVLSIVIGLFSFAARTAFTGGNVAQYNDYNAGYGYDSARSAPAFEEESFGYANKLSVSSDTSGNYEPTNNQAYSPDGDFEIKEYRATVETANLDEACSQIETLRTVEGVIFENANRNDDACFYSFKIEKEDEAQAVAIIESLDPKDFNESVYTIKKVIENYDTELSILESKLGSVEQMLSEAESQYGEFQKLAAKEGDVESLASIFDSRLKYVNQFNSERTRIIEQIQRYNKNKSDQLERLLYSTFTVNIYEDKIVDFEQIGDSWKYELERFVKDANEVVQDVTLNLGIFLMRAFEVALYFFVGLFILKFAWVGAKRVWHSSFSSKKREDDYSNDNENNNQ